MSSQNLQSVTTNSNRKLLTTTTAVPPAEQGTQKKLSPRTAATRKRRYKRPTNGDQPDHETSRLSSHSRPVEKHQVADPHLRTANSEIHPNMKHSRARSSGGSSLDFQLKFTYSKFSNITAFITSEKKIYSS